MISQRPHLLDLGQSSSGARCDRQPAFVVVGVGFGVKVVDEILVLSV
jgi:hypothetical protein